MNLTPEERAMVEEALRITRYSLNSDQYWLTEMLPTMYKSKHMTEQRRAEYEGRIRKHELWIGIYEKLLGEVTTNG